MFKLWYDYLGDFMLVLKNKRVSNLTKALLSFFLFFSSSYLQMLLVNLFQIKKVTSRLGVIINALSSLIIAILLILLYRKDLMKEFKIYKKNLADNIDIGIKYWLFGILGMMISNIIIGFVLNGGQAANEQAVQKMIHTLPYLVIVSAGILAPMIEEIVFRKTFKDNIKNGIIYILVSGIFFGYLHVAGADSLVQLLYIIPYSSLGIAFAIMYQKTNTVFTSMSMHMFHNIMLTVISIFL